MRKRITALLLTLALVGGLATTALAAAKVHSTVFLPGHTCYNNSGDVHYSFRVSRGWIDQSRLWLEVSDNIWSETPTAQYVGAWSDLILGFYPQGDTYEYVTQHWSV